MKIYGFIICALLLIMADNARAQKNLAVDGDFENELFGWENNGAKLNSHNNKNSCVITTNDDTKWVGIDQSIKVPRGVHRLRFGAWLKAVNVVKGKNAWDGALFTVEYIDEQAKKIGALNIATITGTVRWSLAEKDVKLPHGTKSVKILIAMGYAKGTLFADDVKVIALNKDGSVRKDL